MDSLEIKPNYAAIGRQYGMDWRTVKKYHQGYRGKPKSRDKPSRLDVYKNEITDKLNIKKVTIKAAYEFMVRKYGIAQIGRNTLHWCPNMEKYLSSTSFILFLVSPGLTIWNYHFDGAPRMFIVA